MVSTARPQIPAATSTRCAGPYASMADGASELPAMKAACSKLSAGGENQFSSPCAIRPKLASSSNIQATKDAISMDEAKLVDTPVLV